MNDILFGYALGIMTLPLGIGIFHIYKWLVSAGYISPSKAEKKREAEYKLRKSHSPEETGFSEKEAKKE